MTKDYEKRYTEPTEKEAYRERLIKDTKLFLTFKRNRVKTIPVGVSGETIGLNKKQRSRFGRVTINPSPYR